MITYEDFEHRKTIYVILPDFEMLTIVPDIYEVEVSPKCEEFASVGNVGGRYFTAWRCFLTKKEAKEFARKELNRLLGEYK